MNGLEFLKLATINHPDTVNILITAYRDEYLFTEAVRIGITEFIDKPFSVKALAELLAISLKRQTKKRLSIGKNEHSGNAQARHATQL